MTDMRAPLTPADGSRLARTARPSARLAAAVLVPVVIIGVIAVGAYLERAADDDLPTTVLPSIPPIARVSPGPDASSTTIGRTWEMLTIEDGSTGRYISAVTFAGSDLVGVGRGGCVPDFVNPTDCYGAAWTAAAGEDWVTAPDQAGLEMGLAGAASGPEKSIDDVADGPAGLVAVGYDYDPPRSACAVAPCSTGPAVWRSADGLTWERAHVDLGPGIVDRFAQPIAAVVADDRGYVMVGYAHTLAGDGSVGARAAAWTSPDGIEWTRANDSDDMDVGPCVDTGEEPSCGGMLDVAVTSAGYIAVGHTLDGTAGQGRPVAWTSPDGLTWTRASDGLDFDGRLSAVTAGGPGIVSVGVHCQPDCMGVIASSVDGSSWTSVAAAGAPALTAVASSRGHLFAIGVMEAEGPGADGLQLWRSDDAVEWRREPSLPTLDEATQYLGADIAATPDQIVIVGSAVVAEVDPWQNFSYSSQPIRSSPEPVTSPSVAPASSTGHEDMSLARW